MSIPFNHNKKISYFPIAGFENSMLPNCRVELKILPDVKVDLLLFLGIYFLIVGFFSLSFLIAGFKKINISQSQSLNHVLPDCKIDLKILLDDKVDLLLFMRIF
jgi:hypothetical protein